MKHMHPVFGSVNLLTLSCGLPPSAGTLVRVRRRRFFWKDPAVRLFQLTSEQQCREMNGWGLVVLSVTEHWQVTTSVCCSCVVKTSQPFKCHGIIFLSPSSVSNQAVNQMRDAGWGIKSKRWSFLEFLHVLEWVHPEEELLGEKRSKQLREQRVSGISYNVRTISRVEHIFSEWSISLLQKKWNYKSNVLLRCWCLCLS